MQKTRKLYSQIQNLLLTTKQGHMMKYLLLSMTDTEEIRQALQEAVDQSGYKRKDLAEILARKYPLENWTERSLNYLLSDSTDISSSKANQIMELLFPEKEFEFSLEHFQEHLDDMYERLSALRKEFSSATQGDHKINDKELKLIEAQVNVLTHLINKFYQSAIRAVNQRLA